MSSKIGQSLLFVAAVTLPCLATEPPQGGGRMPDVILRLRKQIPDALTFGRALQPMMDRILAARAMRPATPGVLAIPSAPARPFERFRFSPLAGAPVSGATKVTGSKFAPVVLTNYRDSPAPPYPAANLQRELFDGPWPTGTMTEYYQQASNHQFLVSGTVYDWKQLPQGQADYEGPDYMDENGVLQHCHGLCDYTKLLSFIRHSLDTADIDWSKYDNDGPDGAENSGDDNEYVDFVAIVHAGIGGECTGSRGLWSHRWRLSAIPGGTEYVTKTRGKNGQFIKIDDYVIVPALACDGSTMIQIGVFTHEFGHVFGLPDLYDTDATNGRSEGIGNWCLMAGGSWGGDGNSPERPALLSAWALDFLGWANVRDISADEPTAKIFSIEGSRQVFRVRVSPTVYYFVNNIQQKGFNSRLPGSGLQIWKIDEDVLVRGLKNNTVNADVNHKGVGLEEADGLRRLDGPNGFRGDANDLFAGPQGLWRKFDNTSRPASMGNFAVCGISDSKDPMIAAFVVSRGTCGAIVPTTELQDNVPDLGKIDGGGFSPNTVSVADLLNNPAKWRGQEVHVVGTINNASPNFFSPNQRLVLTDSFGRELDVKVGLPREVFQANTGGSPASVSAILGKKLDVQAIVESDPNKPGQTILNIKKVQPVM